MCMTPVTFAGLANVRAGAVERRHHLPVARKRLCLLVLSHLSLHPPLLPFLHPLSYKQL